MTTYHTSSRSSRTSYEFDGQADGIPRYSQLLDSPISLGERPLDVPTAVSTLLGSTKTLQKSLELWSTGRATDSDVSDLYVRIGHEFNATINAFGQYGIDLSDMYSVPSELRVVLEQCLSEEPSPAILQRFLPDLRAVLVKLLKGLQSRQGVWRAAVRLNG